MESSGHLDFSDDILIPSMNPSVTEHWDLIKHLVPSYYAQKSRYQQQKHKRSHASLDMAIVNLSEVHNHRQSSQSSLVSLENKGIGRKRSSMQQVFKFMTQPKRHSIERRSNRKSCSPPSSGGFRIPRKALYRVNGIKHFSM